MDADWIAAGAGFLAGVVILALITLIVVLIDIRVELTQTTRRQRRDRDTPDEWSGGVTFETSKKRKPPEEDES